jgi:hypothetical protein
MAQHARSTLTQNLCIYRPKPGSADQLLGLCRKHAPALRASGLVTDEPVRLYRATDIVRHGSAEPYFVETFEWKAADSPEIAHQSPEIMSVWEPMGNHLAELTIIMLEPIEVTT